ncbi:MAG: hypothetical protein KDA77_18655, partial [Planctomycetaceae bacterium]|nr:hypothetical protein [Planctomycetaceae bacterium]
MIPHKLHGLIARIRGNIFQLGWIDVARRWLLVAREQWRGLSCFRGLRTGDWGLSGLNWDLRTFRTFDLLTFKLTHPVTLSPRLFSPCLPISRSPRHQVWALLTHKHRLFLFKGYFGIKKPIGIILDLIKGVRHSINFSDGFFNALFALLNGFPDQTPGYLNGHCHSAQTLGFKNGLHAAGSLLGPGFKFMHQIKTAVPSQHKNSILVYRINPFEPGEHTLIKSFSGLNFP